MLSNVTAAIERLAITPLAHRIQPITSHYTTRSTNNNHEQTHCRPNASGTTAASRAFYTPYAHSLSARTTSGTPNVSANKQASSNLHLTASNTDTHDGHHSPLHPAHCTATVSQHRAHLSTASLLSSHVQRIVAQRVSTLLCSANSELPFHSQLALLSLLRTPTSAAASVSFVVTGATLPISPLSVSACCSSALVRRLRPSWQLCVALPPPAVTVPMAVAC